MSRGVRPSTLDLSCMSLTSHHSCLRMSFPIAIHTKKKKKKSGCNTHMRTHVQIPRAHKYLSVAAHAGNLSSEEPQTGGSLGTHCEPESHSGKPQAQQETLSEAERWSWQDGLAGKGAWCL